MAFRLIGAKPLSKAMVTYIGHPENLNDFFQYLNIFIQDNTLENIVCGASSILLASMSYL